MYFITSTDINDCSPNPCLNEGNCTDGVNSHNCSCVEGYNGTNCENGLFTQQNMLLQGPRSKFEMGKGEGRRESTLVTRYWEGVQKTFSLKNMGGGRGQGQVPTRPPSLRSLAAEGIILRLF